MSVCVCVCVCILLICYKKPQNVLAYYFTEVKLKNDKSKIKM